MSNSQQSRYTPPVDSARAARHLWISAAVLALGIFLMVQRVRATRDKAKSG